MLQRTDSRSMLTSPVLLGIFFFFLPLLGGYAITAVGNAVNTLLLGRVIGNGALAATANANLPLSLLSSVLAGLVTGLQLALCRQMGRQDAENAFRCALSGIVLVSTVSIALGASGLLWMRPLLVLMRTPSEILETAVLYGKLSCLTYVVVYLFQSFLAIFSAGGQGKTVMLFNALSILFSILYSSLFVLWLGLEIYGLLLASLCSSLSAALLCFPFLQRCRLLSRPAHRPFRPDGGFVRQIAALGLPVGMQAVGTGLGALFLQVSINAFLGTDYISATAAAGQLILWLMQPICLWGSAMQVFCGQNLGAMKADRARKAVRLSLLVCGVWSFLCIGFALCFAYPVAGWFTDQPEILPTAALYTKITVAFYPLLALLNTLREAMYATGHTSAAIWGGMAEVAGNVLAALLLIPQAALPGALFAKPLSWVLSCSVFAIAYLHYLQKQRTRNARMA